MIHYLIPQTISGMFHSFKRYYMLKKLSFLLLLAIFVASCSTTARIPTNDHDQTFNKTNPALVEVYSLDKIGKKYVVLGSVIASADAGEDASIAVNLLKEQASKLGADAIVNLRISFCFGYFLAGMTSTGTAIKFVE